MGVPTITVTSRVLRIKEVLKYEEGKTDAEDFDDVKEDMQEGCGAHGKTSRMGIVTPQAKPNITDWELNIGDVLMECASQDDAQKIVRNMSHRKYDGRLIQF